MGKMSRAALTIGLMLAAMAGGGPVRADDKTLVVGVEELDYQPIYFVRDGAYGGAAREILDAFAQASGYRLTYQPLPVKRLFAELVNGGIDLKFPDSPNWNPDIKKDHKVAYSAPVIRYIDGVMVLPEHRAKGLAAFATLGTVTGFTPFAWLDRIQAGTVKLVENAQTQPLLRQALTGRIDGAYASVAVAHYALDHQLNQPGGLVYDPGLPHTSDAYLLSSTRHPEVIAAFDSWLAANGAQVQAIKDRTGAEKGVE